MTAKCATGSILSRRSKPWNVYVLQETLLTVGLLYLTQFRGMFHSFHVAEVGTSDSDSEF